MTSVSVADEGDMRGSRTFLLLPLTLLYLPNQTELQSESNSRRDQQQLLPHQATRRTSKRHIKAFLQLAIFFVWLESLEPHQARQLCH